MNPECVWSYESWNDAWETECGELHQFTSDGPNENNYKFCPYCGGNLKIGVVGSDDDK